MDGLNLVSMVGDIMYHLILKKKMKETDVKEKG